MPDDGGTVSKIVCPWKFVSNAKNEDLKKEHEKFFEQNECFAETVKITFKVEIVFQISILKNCPIP